MKIFVIVPLFNEKKHAPQVLKELSDFDLPVVVVDDGSTDGSLLKIKEKRLKNIVFLEHKINLGKGAAMKTGAEYAFSKGADAIIFMDADGQHKPEDLPKFIENLNKGKYDVVFGSRNLNFGVPLVRYVGNKIASMVASILFGVYVSDVICGFRALTKRAYKTVEWESTGYGVETEIVARAGKRRLRYCEIPVETIYHDHVKGVTILDAISVFGNVIKWWVSLK